MVQISPKLILLSELVVGRAENQPSKECLLYPRKYLHLPKMNYSGGLMG